MTAILVIGVFAMILLVATVVVALHIVRQSVSDAFRALERIESRQQRQVDTLMDRLMTIKWEDFAAIQATTDEDEGGFVSPKEQKDEGESEIEQSRPVWGALRERLQLSDAERELLEEDFPVEMGVDR